MIDPWVRSLRCWLCIELIRIDSVKITVGQAKAPAVDQHVGGEHKLCDGPRHTLRALAQGNAQGRNGSHPGRWDGAASGEETGAAAGQGPGVGDGTRSVGKRHSNQRDLRFVVCAR